MPQCNSGFWASVSTPSPPFLEFFLFQYWNKEILTLFSVFFARYLYSFTCLCSLDLCPGIHRCRYPDRIWNRFLVIQSISIFFCHLINHCILIFKTIIIYTHWIQKWAWLCFYKNLHNPVDNDKFPSPWSKLSCCGMLRFSKSRWWCSWSWRGGFKWWHQESKWETIITLTKKIWKKW